MTFFLIILAVGTFIWAFAHTVSYRGFKNEYLKFKEDHQQIRDYSADLGRSIKRYEKSMTEEDRDAEASRIAKAVLTHRKLLFLTPIWPGVVVFRIFQYLNESRRKNKQTLMKIMEDANVA